MNSMCKTCNSIECNCPAPKRNEYKPQTMYDYMPGYSQFKREKAMDQQIKLCKEQCINQNPKFTDFTIEPTEIDSIFDTLSTQDVAIFRNAFKMNRSAISSENDRTGSLENNTAKRAASLNSLLNISRSPINCPVTQCQQTVGVTSLLSHFLRDHKQTFPIDFKSTSGDNRSLLVFDQTIFKPHETICLGILAYGGRNGYCGYHNNFYLF